MIGNPTYYYIDLFGFKNMNALKVLDPKRKDFITAIVIDIIEKTKRNKTAIEKLAATFGIRDKNEVKELTELAIVLRARKLAHEDCTIKERFEKIVDLYYSQVNLSHRTSQSMLLQQYSTPAPIGYLAGVFCGIDKPFVRSQYFEPSAGNGLLTIAGNPSSFIVNEIDYIRNRNLEAQGFWKVLKIDATKSFPEYQKTFDAVITNPPFGVSEQKILYDTFPIKTLEHLMALRALDTMKDEGKAAIIIGGHTRWDSKGRIQAGKQRIFFNYLYSRYNVSAVINIDGKKLYSRQGTAFDTRLILIDGRKNVPSGNAPVYNAATDTVVRTFDELFDRLISVTSTKNYNPMNRLELEAEALALELELLESLDGTAAVPGNINKVMYRHYTYFKSQHPSEHNQLFLLKNQDSGEYETYDLDAERLVYMFSLPLVKFAIIDGRKVHGISITEAKLAQFKKQLQEKGYQVLTEDDANSFKGTDDDNTGDEIADHDKLYKRYHELQSVYPGEMILQETTGTFVTFNEDAIKLAKTLKIGYINVKGPDYEYTIAGFSKILMAKYIPMLVDSGIVYRLVFNGRYTDWAKLEHEAFWLQRLMDGNSEELGAPYQPASEACIVLDTQVPDSMAFETLQAVNLIKKEVGGDIDNFVRYRLKYPNKAALCKVLSAEQIDAVAMAIYNIEARSQGMVIGDQTGIGKGRIAAAMIRYAVMQGLKPVFLTEKANLFSDIYRDLNAIGSGHLKPFIVNNRESKTDIKDEEGEVIYQAPPPTEQQSIIASREVPSSYDFVLGTYSQFNSAEKKPEKPTFLRSIAADNIFIMDEAHNSSGSSNTGEFMQDAISNTRGVVFLSATFAKRPDNMPIYAMKTAISDCNMTRDDLVNAIIKGGVALQEVLSSQLVAEGQMLRRERSFEGIEVNYITLDEKATEHSAISDNITKILRDIIAFQATYIDNQVEELDKIAVAEGKEVEVREGTSKAGVDNLPYFSKVFQVINQMLFSLKAEAVAERAIMRLREGKKPVIAFSSTMASFIEGMENAQGLPVGDGDTINTDFSEVLRRGLDGIMRYTVKDIDGNPVYETFSVLDLPIEGQREYKRISENIKGVSTGISISPIDVIVKKIKDAGYSVAEVTGRKIEVQLNTKTGKGVVLSRKRVNTNDAFRQFNNNEVDVLLINQSGSTGASAHAIATGKVPKDQVRQRVMLVLQAEQDISTEVQKRGRINRTGQLLKPIYDYVSSAVPAEKRLMMMLQKKLKSLDANTTSNQKQSSKILDVPDFLNKYGDKVVKEYLLENKDINELLDDPLYLKDSNTESSYGNQSVEDAAHKVSGRVAVLSTKMQADFYNEITERYNDFVEYLMQVGEYDLEVEAMNLEAETISSRVIKMGKGTDSAFGDDSVLETVKVNVLKKPFSKSELENLITESLKGRHPKSLQEELLMDYESGSAERLVQEESAINSKYDLLAISIPGEKKIQKILDTEGTAAWREAIEARERELAEARSLQLELVKKNLANRSQYIEKLISFFYIGRAVNYPFETYEGGNEMVPAVFLGFVIDKKKRNPFAPSAIKLRFAIANSNKYLAIPASYTDEILAIIGSSSDLKQPDMSQLLQDWEDYTGISHVARKTRHIIAGNLLQAFSDYKGKLVSYTTINKETKKGILLPENWNPGEQVQDKVVVPIGKALPLIKSLTTNGHIVTNNGMSFFRAGEYYKLVVAASRVKGGAIYLDKDILALIENNNFEKTSDRMVAMIQDSRIDELVKILQDSHGLSITVHTGQIKDLKPNNTKYSNRKKIRLPDKEAEERLPDNVRMLELEAEALSLELELLAA